jgi:hypothetical protein
LSGSDFITAVLPFGDMLLALLVVRALAALVRRASVRLEK